MVLGKKNRTMTFVYIWIRQEHVDHLRWLVMEKGHDDVVGSRRSWTLPLMGFVSLLDDGSFKHDLHLMGWGRGCGS